jgi:DNA helicase II / ATP-dependent DNA helicase PcrA
MVAGRPPVAFPGALDAGLVDRRRRVAAAVREELAGGVGSARSDGRRLGADDRARLARLLELDDELEALLAEASADRSDEVAVSLPATVSATVLMRARSDPDALARELARPLPRRPSEAARFGSRFHAWVEAQAGQPALLDPTEIPGRGESDIDDDTELAELVDRFRDGPYGDRVPVAVEAPFRLVLRDQVVVGRIDAVYRNADGSFDLVDWKTGHDQRADPTQLALYRLAWAELEGVPLEQVHARFYYVRTGEAVDPPELPDRAGLEAALLD